MRNRIYLYIAFALLPCLAYAQTLESAEYVVSYDFVSITDTIENTFTSPHEFVLIRVGEVSHFHSANRQFNDSMKYEYHQTHPKISTLKLKEEKQAALDTYVSSSKGWRKSTTVDYQVSKHFAENTSHVKLSPAIPPQHLSVSLDFAWEIGTEQKSILGLDCYSATTMYGGRKYRAWFAPAIPISDGPYVFGGLPGLIVELSDSRGWYTFTLNSITTDPGEVYWKEKYISPVSSAIERIDYVYKSASRKNNPRMLGVMDVTEEDLLDLKQRHEWRYFMLLESF